MRHGRPETEAAFHLSGPLRAIASAVHARPWTTLLVTAASVLLCVLLTALLIEFKTQRSDLINPNADFHRRWTSYTEAFGDSSDLVVVVEGESPDAIKAALDDLGSRIVREPERFSHVLYKVDPGPLKRKGLQYLSPQQLEQGLEYLDQFRPVLDGGWKRLRLDFLATGLLLQIRDRLRQIESAEDPASVEKARVRLRGTLDHLTRLTRSLELFLLRSEFRNPWPRPISVKEGLPGRGDEVFYVMDPSGTVGFLKARAVDDKKDFNGSTPSINRLRELISLVSARHREVHIGLTGIPVLENDEMRRSQADMIQASGISFVGVGLVLLFGFRGWRHPMLALIMLSVGMAWAFGYTTIAVGHLNILSVSFAAILIGLGIDFAIHFLARYLELRHHGADLKSGLAETSAGVGAGIVTAAVTTSLAFLCALLTDFQGVAELGIIAGGGVLLCAAATFLVLPALITVADRNVLEQQLPTPFEGTALRRGIRRHPVPFMLLSLAAVAIPGSQAIHFENGQIKVDVRYDYNLLNLQADGIESVEIQKRIFQARNLQKPDQGSLLFAVSVADSPDEARKLKKQFLALPTVHHVEELASRLPASPAEQTQLLVQGYQAQLADVPTEIPEFGIINPNIAGRMFDDILELCRGLDIPAASEAATSTDRFLDAFAELELEEQVEILTDFQQRMTASLLAQFKALSDSADPEPVTVDDLPQELSTRFVSRDGRWLVQVYPKESIWDIEPLKRFVDDVRTVDPNVTGTPLQNFEASRQIMSSYQNAAIYAMAAVTFVLLIDFLGPRPAAQVVLPSAVICVFIGIATVLTRGQLDWWIVLGSFMSLAVSLALAVNWRSVLFTVLALLPPLAGGVLMYGVLAILAVDLNPANLIVLPLILGIGVDDGVHVVHDFRSQSHRYELSASTMDAIVLTSLTSMIGFGSMMVAAHRGLYSLGLVLVIGVGSCLFISLVLLPALLTLFDPRRRMESHIA